jgi:hypothetical protein
MADDVPQAPPSPDAATAPAASPDVLLLHSPTEDGEGVRVVRAREERLELGEVRPLKEGKPIRGEVVRLKPREGTPRVCDVEVMAKVDAPAAPAMKGPAQVASRAYRDSWDRIFGPVSSGADAPN